MFRLYKIDEKYELISTCLTITEVADDLKSIYYDYENAMYYIVETLEDYDNTFMFIRTEEDYIDFVNKHCTKQIKKRKRVK